MGFKVIATFRPIGITGHRFILLLQANYELRNRDTIKPTWFRSWLPVSCGKYPNGEKRGDLIYTKPMLLAIGDMFEEQIAKHRAEDARYR